MNITELLGIAASISLLAGWRMYACVFATGIAMHFGWLNPPQHLASLSALSNWWVIGASGFGLTAEFFADKIAWLDSIWDAVHTAIRPIGGALLTMAIIDPSDPTWQVLTILLGGGATLVSHAAKAGTRAVVNASPEPFSNIAVSTAEDVATGGLYYLVVAHPAVAGGVALALAALIAFIIVKVHRLLKRFLGSPAPVP
jgi:hypothetical protein